MRITKEVKNEFKYDFLVNNGWKFLRRLGPVSIEVYCEKCGMIEICNVKYFNIQKMKPCLCNFIGKTFGRLTILKIRFGQALCKCLCGDSLQWVKVNNLTNGDRKSCGCLKEEFYTKIKIEKFIIFELKKHLAMPPNKFHRESNARLDRIIQS